MAITQVTSGLKFPEGPVVMADGSVIVVEIQSGDVTRVLPNGKKQLVAHVGGGPNGAAIGPDGALYICNNGGFSWAKVQGVMLPGHQAADYTGGSIQRVDLSSGKVDVLYTHCDGRQLSGPNDIVFDKTGGFWFTDHAKSTHHHRVHGALFYARPDGSHISCAIAELAGPNGVGLSPDDKTVYYAETFSGRLFAAKIAKPGQLAKTAGLLPGGVYVGQTPGYSLYDSLAVQANGDVCVATLINSGISTISPKGKVTFKSLAQYKDPLVTNIAFGGKGMKTAWITVSGRGLLISMPWPKPGLELAFNA
ncbi:MAG TPA: SMP-30/gluconolactonase/LRE family protein [Myxococcota bacterium]|nr:SMP-30/gluconolactonase/LRE family protein [Myxococcota bacterium]